VANDLSANENLIDLLTLDYQESREFAQSLLQSLGTWRGWLITIWLALTALAVDRSAPYVAFLTLIAVITFGLRDCLTSWNYRVALDHAIACERVLKKVYFARALGADDAELGVQAEKALSLHTFGSFTDLPRFNRSQWRRALPTSWFAWIYILLALTSIGIGITLIAKDRPSKKCRHKIELHTRRTTWRCATAASHRSKHGFFVATSSADTRLHSATISRMGSLEAGIVENHPALADGG
jgi:hypothetical protein